MTDDKVEEHLLTLISITSKLSEQLSTVKDSIRDLENKLSQKTAGMDARFLELEQRIAVLEQKDAKKMKETWQVIRNYLIVAVMSALVGSIPLLIKELLK